MKIHDYTLSDEQIAAGLAAMVGVFASVDVYIALLHAGVPASTPPRGMWRPSYPAYRTKNYLIQRERKAGRIKHFGGGKWERVG